MGRRNIAVIGAGGFAREVKWLIREISDAGGDFDFVGYVVSDLDVLSERDSKDEVVGDLGWLRENRMAVDALAIGIGTPAVRLRVANDLANDFPTAAWPSLIHPSVHWDPTSCAFEAGVLVCAGTVATVGVSLGPFSLINLCCTLGHEATIGAGSVLNPTVNISGGVTVAPGVLIGTGAQVLQYLTIGEGATVGSGAVVTKDVAPGSTVVGIPAAPLRSRA